MIILASASPRRQELLQQIGCAFQVVVSHAEEEKGQHIDPEELVQGNAHRKAAAVAAGHPEQPVLGADTVVALDGHIYGKPRNADEACQMLARLSGRTHRVSTGIALVWKDTCWRAVETTEVTFAPMSAAEIAAYAATGEPLDKAGAYAVQGRAAAFIEGIRGSYSNVVGLPLHCLCMLARKAGIDLYGDDGKGSSTDGTAARETADKRP